MAGYSSDEDLLESLGISLDDANLAVEADTHASVTGIFAQVSSSLIYLGLGPKCEFFVGP